MSDRPKAVEDIINESTNIRSISKPTYLSKRKRQKLALLKEDDARKKVSRIEQINSKVKRVPPDEKEPSREEKREKTNGRDKRSAKTFNFEWDENDDTSVDYQPLVTIPNLNSNVGLLEKHWSEKPIHEMTPRDWRIFKDDYNIISKGGDIPHALRYWEEAEIPPELLGVVIKLYNEPTPIQRATIPLALLQRDTVGVAETGSGKTLAYLIPLLAYVLNTDSDYLKFEHHQNDHNKPLGLILAPTRELALQVTSEARKFCEKFNLTVVSIIGGHQFEETIHSIRDGVHIIVATPGRLIDSIERSIISLDKCYFFIMDEADKMIDMGFEKSLQSIMNYLPDDDHLKTTIDLKLFHIKKRITLMFTATISPPIERLTQKYLKNPGYLFIGSAGEAVDKIDQQFEYIAKKNNEKNELDSDRFTRILFHLKKHKKNDKDYSIIIFANYKATCEQLAYELSKEGFKNTVIHGSKSQEAREKALTEFRTHQARILIATDVAARGIDVPNVSLVINFQMPKKFDEYIHRIGRTGRAGREGTSLTLIDESDSDIFLDLKRFLSRSGKKCPKWLLQLSQERHVRD
ncbi:uncharacterized protein PRCAT00005743001 [Priceomyces carsonii]|uniref:uncharacterized protein n=1 Tax=Priceomyces carsonii TaxID=28549 RepID=UPI002ED78C19|nr:unnamed protein product [Priceomyces carsonii]